MLRCLILGLMGCLGLFVVLCLFVLVVGIGFYLEGVGIRIDLIWMRNIDTMYYIALMANDITGTYSQAKLVFNTLDLHGYTIVDVDADNLKIFRKHLVEMQKRANSPIRFATRKVNNKQLKITRIE